VGGHVHVVAGDLTKIACDAWLLPTDDRFLISRSFARAIGVRPNARLDGYRWRGARATRLHTRRPGPAIWLGDVGRDGARANWYAGCVRPFIDSALEDPTLRIRGPKPRLAVNVLGSGEGGLSASKGAIHRSLLPALHTAAEECDVDLVLVCWKRRALSAAQRVRRDLVTDHVGVDWDLGRRAVRLQREAKRLADHTSSGELVLFLGAGVSSGAGLPLWQDLLDVIASRTPDAPSADDLHRFDLRDQAALLDSRLSRVGRSLAAEIQRALHQTRYALAHGHLASLPTREAVTTNFDTLFEAAITPIDGRPAVLPYEAARPRQRWLLKLHGSLDADRSVVLTRDDYLGAPVRQGALFGLVQAMLLTRHMLFVGYSLADEDFHQLVHEVRTARGMSSPTKPFGTVLTLFRDDLFTELWPDLHVVPMADAPRVPGKPTEQEIEAAVRRLDIFLDLVGHLSADVDAFLLDRTYADLLDDEERDIAQHLRAIRQTLEKNTASSGRVRALLRDLGAEMGEVP